MSTTHQPNGKQARDSGNGNSNHHSSFDDIAITIWSFKKKILQFTGIVVLVTIIVNFLVLPTYYKATSTLLPETEKENLSRIGEFSDLAQLAGVGVPGSEIARLYPTIVQSEAVLRNVLEREYETLRYGEPVNLIRYMEFTEDSPQENLSKSLRAIRSLLTTAYDNKTSVVTFTLEMPEPQLAADVLNTIVGELDNFMRSKKLTNASEQVGWITLRLTEVRDSLRWAEEALTLFRERNRRVVDSPELKLEQERLSREVLINSTVFIELKKQLELARLDEIRNTPVINVLDYATAPVRKERPRRATNVLIMFFLAVFCASAYFHLWSRYKPAVHSLISSLSEREQEKQKKN